ncbi:hypothetical protein RvY_01439 [Ramazzottius varieornatus]|uniref:Chitin-binding type-2 domain-containing protein n=1 Tax=Ramazzottius varieornatus TaxID=947166 RepID=A0A1D1UGN7_RAMVA|nr:hypothetical protein RvY_01439 [Ramazzottius varieornatus]
MEVRYPLLLVLLYIWETTGQNTWAAHLRRNNKRIASIRKSLLSKGLARLAHTSALPEPDKLHIPKTKPKIPVIVPKRRGSAKRTSSFMAAASRHGYFSQPEEHYDDEPPRYAIIRPKVQYKTLNCYGKPPGSFGNPDLYCKVFHVCQADGRFDKFDCPASLRFNNYLGVCDWPAAVDEYCNPVRYTVESPKREPYQYAFGAGPYMSGNGMSYAAAERFSKRTRTLSLNKEKSRPIYGITIDGKAVAGEEPLLTEIPVDESKPEQR